MEVTAKYGAELTIEFPVIKVGDTAFAATGDWTPQAADTKISKDGGNFTNTSNTPVAIGGTGSVGWKLTLTAGEMEAARIIVQIVDAALENQAIVIATYGHASAQHAFDFDLAALTEAEINAQADLALSDYDPPTKAEMDAGHGLLATESKQDIIDTVVDAIKTITDALPNSGALTDLATILSGLVTIDTEIGIIDGIVDAILADTGELQADNLPGLIAALNNLSAAQVNAEVDTAIADVNLDKFIAISNQVDDIVAPTDQLIYTQMTEETNDHFNGMVILFTSGVLVGQSRRISDYFGHATTSAIAVLPAFTEAPVDGDTFIIFGCQTVGIVDGGIRADTLVPGTLSEDKIATSAFTAAKFHTDTHSYQAKVWLIDDDGSGNDRYAVAWYENGNFLASGVSNVTLWVFTTGAADLIGTSGAPQAMTEVASTHIFKHDEGSDRIVDGVAYIARVRATIDAATRTWMQPVGRDSS